MASVGVASGAPAAFAQSLGDVAKQEEARRKDVKTPAKTYTNKDLSQSPSDILPPPTTPAPDAAKSADAAKPAAGEKAKDAAKDGDKTKDQAYWAGRKKGLQTQLDRDQTYADALQSRMNALNTDFISRDDPAQRATIARDREKASSELERLKKSVQEDKKAIADLDEEARRAGVPAGWLR